MKIQERGIGTIKPYKRNPRKNDGAVDAVAASIREFGFCVPIVIDKDGIIVCGHTRHKAAKKLGMSTIPCVMADDLTEEQLRAYRLADNKTAELSEWDAGLLDLELGEIADIDMGDFGFDEQGPVEVELKRKELAPYTKVHYLLSFDVNIHDEILPLISKIEQHGGVEVESTLN